jgi:hypothetical protein
MQQINWQSLHFDKVAEIGRPTKRSQKPLALAAWFEFRELKDT